MAVFVVVGHTELAKIGARIAADFPAPANYPLPPATWFVEFDGTVTDLSQKLTLTGGGLSAQAVVMPVTGYTGWAPSALWDWIRPRFSKQSPSPNA
jgi:hypothetical protein